MFQLPSSIIAKEKRKIMENLSLKDYILVMEPLWAML